MAVTFLNFYDSSLSASVWVSECEFVCEWVSGCERVSECELARVGAYVSVHGGKRFAQHDKQQIKREACSTASYFQQNLIIYFIYVLFIN